jgi:hypothetical protein
MFLRRPLWRENGFWRLNQHFKKIRRARTLSTAYGAMEVYKVSKAESISVIICKDPQKYPIDLDPL